MGVRGHDPTGSDRLLIRPAAMVTRPVPAAQGHFERKARPGTAGDEGATRAASPSLHVPAPGEQPVCLPSDGRLRSEPLSLPTPTRSGAQAGTAGSITVATLLCLVKSDSARWRGQEAWLEQGSG